MTQQTGSSDPCIFCSIVAGDAEAVRVHEDDLYLAFLDIRPLVRGHTLVIPKEHHTDLTDTPPEVVTGLVALGQRIALAARRSELAATGSNVFLNDGKDAFQTVFHLHLHVAPRRPGSKLALGAGLLLRRDGDREETGRILRDAIAAD